MKNNTTGLSAVIVDDEEDLCFLLQKILAQEKIKSLAVNTLKDAESALRKMKPGIIFLDNHLPDGSGVEKINEMKMQYPGARIVMMTAFNVDNVRDRALSSGADCFLTKPFSKGLIEKTLSDLNLRPTG